MASAAAYPGRAIVGGKEGQGTVSEESRNQPWDGALRGILQGQGLAASEDALSGIITVDSYANILNRQASEPLQTQLVSINYARASGLVPTIQKLLPTACPVHPSSPNQPRNAPPSATARDARSRLARTGPAGSRFAFRSPCRRSGPCVGRGMLE